MVDLNDFRHSSETACNQSYKLFYILSQNARIKNIEKVRKIFASNLKLESLNKSSTQL